MRKYIIILVLIIIAALGFALDSFFLPEAVCHARHSVAEDVSECIWILEN